MQSYDASLLEKPRWLVFTKSDLTPQDEARERAELAVSDLGWSAPWYLISSVSGDGTRKLMSDVMSGLEAQSGTDPEPVSEK
jgi:GTP-binding protein